MSVPRIIGSIQARMNSTRLPGKVLMDISGKPMLLRHIQRLKRSRILDEVVVATTCNPQDDAIVSLCKAQGIPYYRGPEDDVLGRVAGLIREFKADVHAEFFGDSPLTDAHLVDEVAGCYLKRQTEFDCATNSGTTTYPPGQEVIVYRGAALLDADATTGANDPLREHSSIHITRHPNRFRILNLKAPDYYHFPDTYLEVDTPEDFKVIAAIFGHFLARGQDYFSLAQILDFLASRPDLTAANRDVPRRWKQFRQPA